MARTSFAEKKQKKRKKRKKKRKKKIRLKQYVPLRSKGRHKYQERGKFDTPNTQIHENSLFGA
jgi:hypothetical protein